MAVILRAPVAAGSYYEIDKPMLIRQLEYYFSNAKVKPKKIKVLASIAPHSTYFYSGKVAANSFASFEKSNFVIIGSNHLDYGANFALMKNSMWKTPIGEVITDNNFADMILKGCKLVEFDAIPHENEFSIEVQLPFLLHKFGEIKFVPILVSNLLPEKDLLDSCKIVGTCIGKLLKVSKNWKLVGSSDLSRNIGKEITESVDKQLMKPILKLDAKGFFNKVIDTDASVCGAGAITTTLFAAKEMGAKKGELLSYDTTPEINEGNEIIGYPSVIFY